MALLALDPSGLLYLGALITTHIGGMGILYRRGDVILFQCHFHKSEGEAFYTRVGFLVLLMETQVLGT